MKKILLFVILILSFAFLVNAQNVQKTDTSNAPVWTADVTPVCQGACLEDSQAVWKVNVKNIGKVPFQLQGLSLVDSSGFAFAQSDLTKQQAIVPVGQSGTINVKGIVPPPTRGSTLYYKLNYVVGNSVFPDKSFRRMVVMPITDIECTNNDFCSGTDVCFRYKCMPYSMFNSSVVKKPQVKMGAEGYQNILLATLVVLMILFMVIVLVKYHGKKK